MNLLRYFMTLGAVLLVGCASHVAKIEAISGGDFLLQLHQQGSLPGDSKDTHGKIKCYLLPTDLQQVSFPLSRRYQVAMAGSAFTNNYTIVRIAKDSGWQLQRAWQTDSAGNITKEWPVE